MKSKNLIKLYAVFFVISLLSIAIAVDATVIEKNKQDIKKLKKSEDLSTQVPIKFTIHEGYGCECSPVSGVLITSTGSTVESALTDEEGECELTLEPNYEYRITIEKQDYNSIIFDFNVIDEQSFIFYIEEESSERKNSKLLYQVIEKYILR